MPSPIPGPPPFATSLLSGLVSTTTQQFGGDKEFLGKIQATGNPIGLGVFTDGTRPAAASHPGAILYNTTVAKVQFSNGSIWASLDAGAGSFVQTTGDTMTGQLNIVGAGIAVDTADNTFIVDATNNRVGLGTATPQFPLEISLPSPSDYSVHITNPSNPGFSAIRFSSHLGAQALTLGFGNAGSAAPYASKNFLALNGADLIVTGTGDVVTASFKDNGDFFVDTNTLYVDAANNRVGIGTSSPGFPLSVNGIVSSSSGGFRFPDATTQTTAFVPTSYVAKIGDTMSGQLTITGAGLVVDSADNTLVVDATNNRVAIGHNAPTRAFDIRTAHGSEHLVRLRNTDVTGASGIGFESNSGPERLRVGYANPSFGGALQGLNFIATDSSTDLIIAHSAAEYHRFFAGTGNIAFDSTDNLLFLDTANNRIGILQGTPSTSHILDFNPTLGTNGHIVKLRNNSASGYADIEFYQQGGQFAGAIGWGNGSVTGGGAGDFSINYGTNGLSLRNGTTTHHNFQGSAGNITFDVADNVFHLNATTNQIGINTTTLTGFGGYTHPLIVELGTSGTRSVLIRGGGTISKGISFHDTTNTRTWTWDHRPSAENNRMELWYHNGTSPTRILTTTTDGRLGINNTTPTVELDVTGSGQLSGGLTVDTDTLVVSAPNSNVGIGGTANSAMKLHVFDGNAKIQGTGDAASIRLQRTETVDGSINPEFKIGTIVSGGVNLPMLKFTFSDQNYTDKDCFIVESSGTVASVSDGVRRSHYEAFLQTGDVDPIFRLSSSPYMTLEMGPGGVLVSAGGMVRTSGEVVVTCDDPHGLAVGSTFHLSHTEADFPAILPPSVATVTVVDSPTVFRFNQAGADASSTIDHFVSGVTDVHLSRVGPFTARMSLGGGAKTTWYPDVMLFEPGYDLKVNEVGGIPLLWASAGYDRVAMGVAVPGAKLHVKGTVAGEIVNIIQGTASQSNHLTEWQNNGGTPLAHVSKDGFIQGAEVSAVNTQVPDITDTGIDVNYNGDHRRGYYKVTISYTAWSAAALTEDLVVCTIPAKARVVSVIADTPFVYAGTGAAAYSLRLGHTTGGQEYILDHDVLSGTVTKGLADADLGTSINRANAVQGGHIPSWTASTDITARLTSDVNISNITAGQTTFYITVEFL